ncbi:hypothetical protein B0H63DRAFT_155437 [Podospora didyma]|uniref:Pathway-specific nitrogen regulator n=1 Tax=Podospora didyma TaxID=330526 RepID=A0AAE0NTM8_9PEZI|nr:hypothetical protein B0H63DRAFT_155437 [Podospora didyma]
MPRKTSEEEFDFSIFVDPSCLSAPMDDITEPTQQPPATEEAPILEPESTSAVETAAEGHPEAEGGVEEEHDTSSSSIEPFPTLDVDTTFEQDPIIEPASYEHEQEVFAEEQEDTLVDQAEEEPEDQEAEADVSATADDSILVEQNVVGETHVQQDAPVVEQEVDTVEQEAHAIDQEGVESSEDRLTEIQLDEDAHVQDETCEVDLDADADTPKPPNVDSDAEDDEGQLSQQPSFTERKTSLRTEALIQAAARAVIATIEGRSSNRNSTSADSIKQDDEEEADRSLLSVGTQDTYGNDETQSSHSASHNARRRESSQSAQSSDSQIHHTSTSRSLSGDDGGDSSSHHEADDDDVFSDRSARSSIGSFEGVTSNDDNPEEAKTPQAAGAQSHRESFDFKERSPRLSGVSTISGLSQYDKDDFVPTSRDTRMPFRTPSAVRAMQMTSPTPSVFHGGGSPRSSKRHTGGSTGILPTVSRLGSPVVSAQYSPKGRSTPTRFKSRKEAPLVLLHVTLLPLRWMWGDILNGMDAVNGKAFDVETGETFYASEQLKTLRDAWRELQDRVGDTVLERGILLPHPQNDYEVLEERLLEALELPVRRRARILECGHYLGPANEEDEDEQSDDEYASQSGQMKDKRHWCNTCRGEIRLEDLGPGKRVFRVKVYASNGLMKAGAWDACWKEMERVDSEVEPVVEPAVQGELERLAAIQIELEEQRHQAMERERFDEQKPKETAVADVHDEEDLVGDETLPVAADPELPYMDEPLQSQTSNMSSPPTSSMQITMHASPAQPPPSTIVRVQSPTLVRAHSSRSGRSEPIDTSEERRRRDEERLREIYGETPAPVVEHMDMLSPSTSMHVEPTSSSPRHPDSYIPPPTPRSPSEEAYERRQHREAGHTQTPKSYDNSSFSELLLEAFKVLLRDPKNVAIIVLLVLVWGFVVRPAPDHHLPYRYDPKQEVVMMQSGPDARVEVAVAAVQVQQPHMADLVGLNTPAVELLATSVTETPTEIYVSEIAAPSTVSEPLDEVPSVSFEYIEAVESVSAPVEDVGDLAPEAHVEASIDEQEPLTGVQASDKATEVHSDIIREISSHQGDEDSPLKSQLEAVSDGLETALLIEDGDTSANFVPVELNDTLEDLSGEDTATTPVPNAFESKDSNEPDPSVEFGPKQQAMVASDPLSASLIDEADLTNSATSTPDAPFKSLDNSEPTTSSHPCESYAKLHASPPAVLTERKTVRIYETITETVKVQITAAETASSVETAVPSTVEEVVYETETVRITVSVPMDDCDRPVPTALAGRDEL